MAFRRAELRPRAFLGQEQEYLLISRTTPEEFVIEKIDDFNQHIGRSPEGVSPQSTAPRLLTYAYAHRIAIDSGRLKVNS